MGWNVHAQLQMKRAKAYKIVLCHIYGTKLIGHFAQIGWEDTPLFSVQLSQWFLGSILFAIDPTFQN